MRRERGVSSGRALKCTKEEGGSVIVQRKMKVKNV